MRYHGGKWRLAPWIIQHFPTHKVYIEPYGGAASVLLQKSRAFSEVYNDMDSDIVTVFEVLRDSEKAAGLIRLIKLTPYARDELRTAYCKCDDPVEKARRLIVKSFMGYSSDATTRKTKTGFRGTKSLRLDTWKNEADSWCEYPDELQLIVSRMKKVVIENRPALRVIEQYDTTNTLFYVDPPYLPETRQADCSMRSYRHEMTVDDHIELIRVLKSIKGMAVLSGFRSELYDSLLTDWILKETTSRGQSKRGSKLNTECIWISPNTVVQENLFDKLFPH